MFQGLQAGEGFLGHRFDLVSKQSPAVAEHAGCQLMEGGEEEVGRERDAQLEKVGLMKRKRAGGAGNVNWVKLKQEKLLFKDNFYLFCR